MASGQAKDQAITGMGDVAGRGASGPQILVVGLGPGRWDDLTVAARDTLLVAPVVVCRTLRHPTVEALRAERPDLALDSFDGLYETAESFAGLYPRMADELLARAARLPAGAALVYAVPGHPLIAEESVRTLRRLAPERGVTVRIIAGLSFLEPVCAALDLDPFAPDLQLLDATLLADTSPAAMMGQALPTHPALIAQAYNRRILSGVKLALGELYPDEWEITVVRSASLPSAQTVERTPLYALDRDERADHLTTLYVPPLAPLAATRVPEGLRYVTARLRAPDGCPWDREQTHRSLRTYVLEEAYEVAEAIDEWDDTPEQAAKLAEELGDLLLQVYLHAEIAYEEDFFHIGDVYQSITEKLIRRHPHVFGEVEVENAAQVVRNWEAIKREERVAQGQDVRIESALRGIPKSAPALYQAYELSRKAAKAGFTWPEGEATEGALAKVVEEARELSEAQDAAERAAEFGDLLFALVTLGRRLGLHAEDTLEAANARFRRRFERLEARARREQRALDALTPQELLAWWADAKTEA